MLTFLIGAALGTGAALAAPGTRLVLDVPPQSLRTGHFTVEVLDGRGGPRVEVRRDGVVRWSSIPGQAFLTAAPDATRLDERRGMASVEEDVGRWCRVQRLQRLESVGAGLLLGGALECGDATARWTVRLEPVRRDTLRLVGRVEGGGMGRVALGSQTEKDDAIIGFGEQFGRLDRVGERWPLVVSEQGIGRGAQPVTWGANRAAGAGGSWWTTYAAVPHLLTTGGRSLALEDTEPVVADLTRKGEAWLEVLGRGVTARLYAADDPAGHIAAHTAWAGRMKPLPDWVHAGAIVGIQGGSARVRAAMGTLEDAEVPVAGVWLQDWVGQRETSFGKQLWWSWSVDGERYPGWSGLVAELAEDDVAVLTYVNPFLVSLPAGSERPDLYREARAAGHFVEKDGAPYPVENTDFAAGMLDLSDPETRAWATALVRDRVAAHGVKGWMADFGEALPFDAEIHAGTARAAHNAYPVAWAEVNAAAVAGTDAPDERVFFMRSAHTRSPASAPLFWLGDQMVSWDDHDGLGTVVPGLVSSGLSGFALNHSDIGGYTTITHPIADVHRSKELFQRWAELAAFTPVFRTHEGNQPEQNHQWDSDGDTLAHFSRMATLFSCLQPYRQDLMQEAARTGMPLVRHPWLASGDPDDARDDPRTFLLGPDLFVAPVVRKRQDVVRVTLPEGLWVHAWSGRIAQGGQRVKQAAPIGEPAAWARADSLPAALIRDCSVHKGDGRATDRRTLR
jgi:alpha-glucosidase